MAHKVNRFKGLLFETQDYKSVEEQLKRKWKVKEGQLWSLGQHKMYVGAAGTKHARRALITQFGKGKMRVDGICTDPPYDLDVAIVARIMRRYSDKAVVLASDNIAFGLANHWRMRLDFIWIHDEPRSINAESRPVYHHNHIIILTDDLDRTQRIPHGSKGLDKEIRTGWRRPRPGFSSVVYVGTRAYYRNHGKGVFLFEEMLAGFKKWKVVVDPFLGYGTTIIAAENLGKVCLGAEIRAEAAAITLERVNQMGLCKPRLL